MATAPSLRDLPTSQLEAIVHARERSVFAGTSSHDDVVLLIDAEQELMRRFRNMARPVKVTGNDAIVV